MNQEKADEKHREMWSRVIEHLLIGDVMGARSIFLGHIEVFCDSVHFDHLSEVSSYILGSGVEDDAVETVRQLTRFTFLPADIRQFNSQPHAALSTPPNCMTE
jgi:hypothetical protein